MPFRIFVEKKKSFDLESTHLLFEVQEFSKVQYLKIFTIYDLFGIDKKTFYEKAKWIFSDPISDIFHEKMDIPKSSFAVEYHPGQFDQRADSAEQCLELLGIRNGKVRAGKLYVFNENISKEDLDILKKYILNPLESREKNLNTFNFENPEKAKDVDIIEGFIEMGDKEIRELHLSFDLSMGIDDLQFIQNHFQTIGRNPTETELLVLDTYWSDHCRHTTFETEITNVRIESKFKKTIQKSFNFYLQIRKELGVKKPMRLMDLASIMKKYLMAKGIAKNIDISWEVNACSIEIPVDVNGKTEDWLLQFKNETHNHPTEVEPFGGASTCIGGAIRDPLSGRAYVFQAMRITGSANPLELFKNTLSGKLPQRKITTKAAHGYSSYGNQIGLATTFVKELYHEGFKAKRMEVGFVAGAVKKDWVRREIPQEGDIIILLGGKTGRDGIGGATGSSKVHDGKKLEVLSAEVQKGNAPTERKIQRLFRNEQVIRIIKRANDFGAGGVSVAIGEIARGVRIDLDRIPVKYIGLNGTELALSESQERMAIVLEKKDEEKFKAFAEEENLEATTVATVTNGNTMTMRWKGKTIVELDRAFLDTNGIRKQTQVVIDFKDLAFPFEPKPLSKKNLLTLLSNLNSTSQKGLVEHFDSNIGRSTVLMPFGGKYQKTPEDLSVQKIPVDGNTNTVSMASFGYNPQLSEWNPYFGAYFAVVESVSKIVAAGGEVENIRFTFQEYFQQLGENPKNWGLPFGSLLGALEAQKLFELPAIGGKDSMSGSYKNLHVPPTLISFAVANSKVDRIRPASLKKDKQTIYCFLPPKNKYELLDKPIVLEGYSFISRKRGIRSAMTIKTGGIAETLTVMSLGNQVGLYIDTEVELMSHFPGGIVFSSMYKLDFPAFIAKHIHTLGSTMEEEHLVFNGISFEFREILKVWESTLEPVFPTKIKAIKTKDKFNETASAKKQSVKKPKVSIAKPRVFIPVFPGTNCEYDTKKAFEQAGGIGMIKVFRNNYNSLIEESLKEFEKTIYRSQIIAFPGGFSAGDEPDGSAKYIVAVLKNQRIKEAINQFLEGDGIILGICNGFQALIKSGLLPYGRIQEVKETDPTLSFNSINRHVSQMVCIRVVNDLSPWIANEKGNVYCIPISHAEGRFVCGDESLKRLINNGQIATRYVDLEGKIASSLPYNPNGSKFAVEGITSLCGKIFGRMGHAERYEEELMKNIPNMQKHNIFSNGVNYFK